MKTSQNAVKGDVIVAWFVSCYYVAKILRMILKCLADANCVTCKQEMDNLSEKGLTVERLYITGLRRSLQFVMQTKKNNLLVRNIV